MIDDVLYQKIISEIPIICVDLILKDSSGKYLLGKRRNNPLIDEWWLIGGRVHIGETLKQSCLRKASEELGLNLNSDSLFYKGVYQDFFDINPYGDKQMYHTISVVFESILPVDMRIKLDNQHGEWGFFDQLPEKFQLLS